MLILVIHTIAGNKQRQLVIMDITQHRLYYFHYHGTHVATNSINLEFFDGNRLIFYIKIQLKQSAQGFRTIFKLYEKLKNGTSLQHELSDYWIEPILDLKIMTTALL